MSLRLIASYDDLTQLCGLDTTLAEKFSKLMDDRTVTFDPILSCASNPDLLKKGHFFSRKGKDCKRALNAFDEEKFTKYFIKTQLKNLNSKETSGLLRNGFDAYSYLMAYEKEINEVYKRDDLSSLQKAALYFVETGSEERELDYRKFLASYDDLSIGAVMNKPPTKELLDWLPEYGKTCYESTVKNEILSGKRPVAPFFDATRYIASYPETYDHFKSEDGSVDEDKATLAWFIFGVQNGIKRDQFSPMAYLANNPDVCKEDIYTNNKVDEMKVARLWLEKTKDGIDLTSFDVEDFKESHELKEDEDPFKVFVEQKVNEHFKELKKSNTIIKRLSNKILKVSMPSVLSCGSSTMKKTESSPVDQPPEEPKKLSKKELKEQKKIDELEKKLELARKKVTTVSQ